jgi:hypothetical protein
MFPISSNRANRLLWIKRRPRLLGVLSSLVGLGAIWALTLTIGVPACESALVRSLASEYSDKDVTVERADVPSYRDALLMSRGRASSVLVGSASSPLPCIVSTKVALISDSGGSASRSYSLWYVIGQVEFHHKELWHFERDDKWTHGTDYQTMQIRVEHQ